MLDKREKRENISTKREIGGERWKKGDKGEQGKIKIENLL